MHTVCPTVRTVFFDKYLILLLYINLYYYYWYEQYAIFRFNINSLLHYIYLLNKLLYGNAANFKYINNIIVLKKNE